jgi:hypothetical protein
LQWGKRIPRSETMAEQHFSFPHKSSPRSDPRAFWRVYTPHRCKILKLPPSVALFHFSLSALNSLFAACGAEFLCDSSSRNPLLISLKKQGDCAAKCDRSAIPPDLSVERGNLIGTQPSPCATTGEPGGVKIASCRGEVATSVPRRLYIGAAANWTSPPLVLGLEGGLHVFSAESSPVFSKKLPRPKKTWLKCNRTRHSTTTQTPLIK